MSFGYKIPYTIRIQNTANLTKISGGKIKSDPLQSCNKTHQFNLLSACTKFSWRIIQTVGGMAHAVQALHQFSLTLFAMFLSCVTIYAVLHTYILVKM